tara:strand:- start:1493 stop:1921 length:429 start_codon:yes stop_codon:yes gene_type:complete
MKHDSYNTYKTIGFAIPNLFSNQLARTVTFLFDLRLLLSMPLTGLIAEARRRTTLIEEKVEEKQHNPQKLKQEVKRTLDFSADIENAAREKQLHWQECCHLKQVGKNFCKRYMSLCAEDKCHNKYINGEEKELDYKRLLRGK